MPAKPISECSCTSEDSNISSASTISIQDDDDFSSRLHALPREIFDIIEDLTFSAHIESSRFLFHLCHSSACGNHEYYLEILQLSRATREWYAQEFYWQRSFTFESPDRMFKWLNSVAPEHRAYIGDVSLFLQSSWLDPNTVARRIKIRSDLVEQFGAKLARKIKIENYNDRTFEIDGGRHANRTL